MINRTQTWFAAFVVIVFAAGAASGIAIDRAWHWGRRPAATAFRGGPGGPGSPNGGGGGNRGRGGLQGSAPSEAFVNDMADAVKLDADQKARITAIIDASRPRLRALQDEASRKFLEDQQALREEILKVLTPEQGVRFVEWQKQRRVGPFGYRGRGGRGH